MKTRKNKTTSLRYSMVRYSDDSLRAIAGGTNPVMAEIARQILEGRKCPFPMLAVDTGKVVQYS